MSRFRSNDESAAHAATAVGRPSKSKTHRAAGPLNTAATLVDPPLAGEIGRLSPGQRLGRYEVIGLVGRGGMGEVYAAHDILLDRTVAVKVLLADDKDAANAARLVREAQALARLQHPNVVTVFDAGEDQGLVFLAMQLVEGETLATYLYNANLPWHQVVGLYIAAGRGLAAAHAAGIVHRDFKPSNVLVDRSGKVAVTDFGVARAADTPPVPPPDTAPYGKVPVTPKVYSDRVGARTPLQELTHQGALVGTPAYMAREQFYGSNASTATDQYAFCTSLWESLFGAHPYLPPDADGTLFSYAAAIETGILRLPRKHAVPRRVVTALVRGLDKDPARRWPSMDALLGELVYAAAPRRWPWIAAGGSFLAVGLAGTILLVASRSDEAPCDATARQRINAVWGPSHAKDLERAFLATKRAYAPTTAAQMTTDLGNYARSWERSTTDACVTGRRDPAMRQLANQRLACLDRAHAAFASTVASFTSNVEGVVVDNAHAAVDALPNIPECSDDAVGLTATPPPSIASKLAGLETRLDAAVARIKVGQFQVAEEMLTALQKDASGVAWEPLQVRLAFYLAANAARFDRGSTPELVSIAKRASAIGAHKLELDALAEALKRPADLASHERVFADAQAVAAKLGGTRYALQVTLAQARGYSRLRNFPRAASLCRDGLAGATAMGWVSGESEALDCLAEALLPLGQFGDLEPVIERDIALKVARSGGDHPTVGDLLVIRAHVLEAKGKIEAAKADLQRAMEIRIRTFGARDLRVAHTKLDLSGLYDTAGDTPKAIALATEALAIIESRQPAPDNEIMKAHRDLGIYSMSMKDYPAVKRHFGLSLEASKRAHGDRSREYAYLLLMWGQYQTAWDLDAGFATLHQAVELFDLHKDPRAVVARAALANSLEQHGRAAEALPILEKAVEAVDVVNTPPMLVGQMKYSLARAIVKTGGDKARARDFAEDAMFHFMNAGNANGRERIRDWMKKEKIPAARSKRR